MPQGSSAVRPTNGLYLLPFYQYCYYYCYYWQLFILVLILCPYICQLLSIRWPSRSYFCLLTRLQFVLSSLSISIPNCAWPTPVVHNLSVSKQKLNKVGQPPCCYDIFLSSNDRGVSPAQDHFSTALVAITDCKQLRSAAFEWLQLA